MTYQRFAVYYLPPEGELARFGASWLGWDVASGRPVDQPDLAGIEAITDRPRKYGFHATLKPPFRLAHGVTAQALEEAATRMAAQCPPAACDGLMLTRLGRFLALTPEGSTVGVGDIAETCVTTLDRFRAPMEAEELARRRQARLTPRQEDLLTRWGYPYVMEEFRFHMTLTGPLPKAESERWSADVTAHLPPLPRPFTLDAVALVGEREDGYFELIRRLALTG